MESPRSRRSSVRHVAIGCVVVPLVGVLLMLAAYYVLFGTGDTTRYARGYTEAKFHAIKTGMTDRQVRSILGEPLSKIQKIVFTKELPQNSRETGYCSFENGRHVSGSVLLDSRSGGRRMSSIQEAMSLLTPEERRIARIQYEWDYAEPGALLSQRHQYRSITFNTSGIVIDKSSWEWVD